MNGFPVNMLQLTLLKPPDATAGLKGAPEQASLRGTVSFYQTSLGVLVRTEVFGLPCAGQKCGHPVFAMHIHEGVSCTGNAEDPFADAKGHYNPENCPHPQHAGDLPPLFCCHGYALSVCMTDRFRVQDILGRAVIIHQMPDDFMTQPSGNSGAKIACGIIA